MKFILLCLFCVSQAYSSIIDVFEATNGHEPRVAINCGHVPFYVDLQTGAWVEDSTGKQTCDHSKAEVKRYCQKTYPKLNITNIVEANKPQKFNNWCKPGQSQCTEAKKVVPYRCLVNEYEADALMVPDLCKFDHIHDQSKCLSHDEWKEEASKHCKKTYSMKLKDYGILLSCATDKFTGVEFVCCPKKKDQKKHTKHAKGRKHHKKHHKDNQKAFHVAIKKFKKYLPVETKGCDRSTYLTKQTKMEDRHRSQIAAVVDEWDEAEKRYNKLKAKDPVAAEEKMKRTLEVFRQTLAALEQESKDEKSRLRTEHADCINTQISKNKRDAMVNYIATIQKQPVNAEEILKTVRKFIQVCEHDRVHSLRHFEHVRNRDPSKVEALRGELLQHLKDLNKVVNESMALLNYLPEIAKKFGLTGTGAILKPRLQMPEIEKHDHTHKRVEEILKKTKNIETNEVDDADDDSDDEEEGDYETISEPTKKYPIDEKPEYTPMTKDLGSQIGKHVEETEDDDNEDVENENVKVEKPHGSRSPMVINIILGLCCGILVVMLFVVIAMVVQRRRVARTRVIVAENNDDREHLVQMQKSGFENPTYKFFYY